MEQIVYRIVRAALEKEGVETSADADDRIKYICEIFEDFFRRSKIDGRFSGFRHVSAEDTDMIVLSMDCPMPKLSPGADLESLLLRELCDRCAAVQMYAAGDEPDLRMEFAFSLDGTKEENKQ